MTTKYEATEVDGGVHIKSWTKGVAFEEEARKQLENVSRLPFIHKHVAVMPDVHAGRGCTVGSVIPTRGAIVPSFVGVDIGCGMNAMKLPLTAKHLPDSLAHVRSAIEAAVPHGGPGEVGAFAEGNVFQSPALKSLVKRYRVLLDMYPEINSKYVERQFSTLGTGNHFIELCVDENQDVWIMLHSGSRGPGNRIGTFFIEKAKEDMKKYYINLPDVECAYLPEGSKYYDHYISAIGWAQEYASESRAQMIQNVYSALGQHFQLPDTLVTVTGETAISCHHNYVSKEHHFGASVWVTRKGAVRARKGDMGIIPGAMGKKSFIVRGLGNPDSFNSCSHGAGRLMSRTEARRTFSLEDHIKATEGVECRKDSEVIDETPGAYKNLDDVMAAQSDLIEVVHTLKAVLTVKG